MQSKTLIFAACTLLHVIISTHKMNMDLEENVQKYDKFNRCIKRYFLNSIRKEVKLRTHNVI
jgi:hypothetical protein